VRTIAPPTTTSPEVTNQEHPMSTPTATVPTVPVRPEPSPGATRAIQPVRARRARWPIFGAVAGAAGFATSMLSFDNGATEEQREAGPSVIDHLERGNYHIAFLVGLVSIAALLVTAVGWRRWAERRAPDDLAARTIGHALTLTAAVNVMGTAMLGAMALYLPGGMDEGTFPKESLFINYTLLDFGTLFGWWGTLVGAICVAVLAFRRQRVLPRWMGVASVLLALPAVAFAVGTALPGFPGLTMPIWLVVVSIGLMFSRTATA
jgi:hypothetical protein